MNCVGQTQIRIPSGPESGSHVGEKLNKSQLVRFETPTRELYTANSLALNDL